MLRRRWTPGLARECGPAPDCWTSLARDGSARPMLERHWACGVRWNSQGFPVGEDARGSKTVTAIGRELTGVEEIVRSVGKSATVNALHVSTETVTRLCQGCGEPLQGKRPQAKSHDAACRQRAYRWRKKAARHRDGRLEETAERVHSLSA